MIFPDGLGRPPALKRAIWSVIRDGKPRTYLDIAKALDITTDSKVNSMACTIRAFHRAGAVRKKKAFGIVIVEAII